MATLLNVFEVLDGDNAMIFVGISLGPAGCTGEARSLIQTTIDDQTSSPFELSTEKSI